MRVSPILSRFVIPISFGSVSTIAFVVSKLMKIFSWLSTVLIVLACFGIVVGILLDGRKRIAMFVISALLSLFIFLEQRSLLSTTSRSELVSDATESLVDYYYHLTENPIAEHPWISKENFIDDRIRCIIVPSSGYSEFCESAFDAETIIRDDPEKRAVRVCPLNLRQNGKEIQTKYRFVLAYAPQLKKEWQAKGSINLPESSYLTLKGMIEIDDNDWQQGKELLERAKSEGNAAAGYYLSRWYRSGYGDEPDIEKADSLLKDAVESGSRSARYEWGSKVLRNPGIEMSDLKKALAVDYLRDASVLKESIGTVTTANLARESFFMLNDFYRACGKESGSRKYYKAAYRMAKRNTRSFVDNEIRYVALLDNCISLEKYDEALEIIVEGKVQRQPHVYLVHADMLSEGKGVAKNLDEAERLLRFAADSLNHYPAYHGLSILYRRNGKKGSEFWDRLYSIKFSNEVE